MRVFNQLIFDETVVGTTTVYTDPKWNALLAAPDKWVCQAIVDNVGGTSPTLTVASEQSTDNRNFSTKTGTPEINGVTLMNSVTNVFTGYDNATSPSMGFIHFKITLGGSTPMGHVRLWVTGRGEQGGQ